MKRSTGTPDLPLEVGINSRVKASNFDRYTVSSPTTRASSSSSRARSAFLTRMACFTSSRKVPRFSRAVSIGTLNLNTKSNNCKSPIGRRIIFLLYSTKRTRRGLLSNNVAGGHNNLCLNSSFMVVALSKAKLR